MTIEHAPEHSDMFASGAEALVCPVNCVGTLGAGLARIFAGHWPEMVNPYQYACGIEAIVIGRVHTISIKDGVDIVCVPTKNHWRNASELGDVQRGVDALGVEADRKKWKTLAIPALGCGLGKLPWEPVKAVLESTFLYHPTKAILFPPLRTS